MGSQPSVEVHDCKSNTWEMEIRLETQGQPWIQNRFGASLGCLTKQERQQKRAVEPFFVVISKSLSRHLR